MKLLAATVLAVAVLSSGSVVKTPSDNFELLILHNNDMHGRFEQTSQLSGACTTGDRDAGKCYGGFPRVAHVVKEARKAAQSGEGPPVLYLNAGDTYTGTAWFTIYKWKIAAEFINALQPDAVSLGNNEVEPETSEFSPFIKDLNTYILASNVIVKSAQANVQKSIIINVNGVKVGIVGYLTPDNKMLDSIGNVEYIDEVIAVSEEVEKLQAENVNIIIALGHSHLAKEMEIAREVTGIDMVIAGNKNTYYWNGNTVSNPQEPIVVTQESGKKVPVVLSTAYDKYLGNLRVIFDKNGEIVDYTNDPILLDSSIPEDSAALELYKSYYTEADTRLTEVLGQTAVVLDGVSCSLEECNLGNFITDAINHYYASRYVGDTWTDAAVVVLPSAAVAGSIAPNNRPADVTRGDVLSALPLESRLVAVNMPGDILKQMLEHSVSDYNPNNPTGQFLQYSGIRTIFDLDNESGSRLVDAVVRCWSCVVPQFFSIDDWRPYKIIIPAAMADGEYGYSMLVGLEREELVYDEVTCVTEYLNLRSPVYPEIADRIVLRNAPVGDESDSATAVSSSLLIVLLFAIMNLYK